jgi:VanZ family protein
MTHTDGSTRRTAILGLLLYAGFVAYQSLADGGAWDCGGVLLGSPARVPRSDALANVVAYVPLGLLWVFATLGPRVPAGRRIVGLGLTGVMLIALLSLGMEVLQSCQGARVSSRYDLAANVVGGVLGVAAGLVVRRIADVLSTGTSHRETSDGRLRLLTACVSVAWVVSQTMPWVFAVDVGTIRSNLSFVREWDQAWPLDLWRALRHAGAWVAVACAWRLVVREPCHAAAGFVLTGGASLLLQVLLDARAPLSFEELCGMGASATMMLPMLLWSGRFPQQTRIRTCASGLFAAALVTVAAYQLRPDPSVADVSIHAFSWWPRVGLGGLLGATDYALLFGWFGLTVVAAAHWAEIAGDRRARRMWPAAAVLAMLVLEGVQTRIPGRGPDVSAPLFTLLAVLGTTAILSDDRRVSVARVSSMKHEA